MAGGTAAARGVRDAGHVLLRRREEAPEDQQHQWRRRDHGRGNAIHHLRLGRELVSSGGIGSVRIIE